MAPGVRPGHAAPDQDSAAFGRAVLPHLDSAYNLARWVVRDPSLADDVVQGAVLRALRYFASFRGDNMRAWLLRIVRHAAYDALADRTRTRTEDADGTAAAEIPDPADDPETAFARRRQSAWLQQAIANLPAELRECLVLRELEELSYKEIAHITGVPVGTVMSRLWRARQTLLTDGKREAAP